MKVWKEISENSVYIQDRYRNSITKAIETYSDTKMKEFLPSKQGENWAINFAMYTTKLGDKGAIYLGGAPNYSYYKAQALKQGKTEQEAIDIAIKRCSDLRLLLIGEGDYLNKIKTPSIFHLV